MDIVITTDRPMQIYMCTYMHNKWMDNIHLNITAQIRSLGSATKEYRYLPRRGREYQWKVSFLTCCFTWPCVERTCDSRRNAKLGIRMLTDTHTVGISLLIFLFKTESKYAHFRLVLRSCCFKGMGRFLTSENGSCCVLPSDSGSSIWFIPNIGSVVLTGCVLLK